MLRKPEPNLRRGRPNGDAVPTYATSAQLVGMMTWLIKLLSRMMMMKITITCQRIPSLTWHVIRQTQNQYNTYYSCRHNQHKTSAVAPPSHQSISLHTSYHQQVQRCQIPHYSVRNRHFYHPIFGNNRNYQQLLYW